MSIRTRGNSTNALRDPHATLHMQPTREEIENSESTSTVNPYAGRKKPQQRSFTDILGDAPEGQHYDDRAAASPAKIGGGKHYQPMRIFDGQEEVEEDPPKSRPDSRYIKPNPRKYNHFDFADGSDPNDAPQAGVPMDKRPRSKHDSQWSFDDFVTPSKPQPTKGLRAQDVRHWDTDREALGDETPLPAPVKGRRDAEAHFELQDDGEQVPRPERHHKKGSMHNEGLGLYKNQLFQQGGEIEPEGDRPLGNIANIKDRGKDFEPHWTMTDESPAQPKAERPEPVPEARKKAVKMMDANWSAYDESPKQEKENILLGGGAPKDTRIHIAGDGMGGKKGTNRNWLYGGDEEEEEAAPKPAATRRTNKNLTSQQRDFWEF